MLRRVWWLWVLLFGLLGAQQTAWSHAVEHLTDPAAHHHEHRLVASSSCDDCLAHASLGAALAPPMPHLDPAVSSAQAATVIPLGFHSPTVPVFRSRAPPCWSLRHAHFPDG